MPVKGFKFPLAATLATALPAAADPKEPELEPPLSSLQKERRR